MMTRSPSPASVALAKEILAFITMKPMPTWGEQETEFQAKAVPVDQLIDLIALVLDDTRREVAMDAAETFGKELAKAAIKAEEDIAAARRDGAREALKQEAHDMDTECRLSAPQHWTDPNWFCNYPGHNFAKRLRARAAALETEGGQ